jgi:bla regulator protein BlaR1
MILNNLSAIWSALAPALGNHLWQSTLFALMAGLLTLLLRKNHARIRYRLWLAASVKFLIPFALLVALGSHLARSHGSAPTNAGLYLAMQEVSQPFVQPTFLAISSPTPETIFQRLLHFLPVLVTAAWLCGFVAVLSIWYVRWQRISAAMREAAPLREGREVEALRRIERTTGIAKQIEMRLSRSSLELGIFGIARPVLVWPEGISARLDDSHLEAILAHELWHARRKDNLAAAIHMLVEAIFWFHPLVWWLGSRLVAERECACDEAVLESGSARKIYAESILKICEFCLGSPLDSVSGVTGADLKKRIARIMSDRIARKLDFSRKLLLGAASLLTVAAPIAFGLLHAAQSRAQSQDQNSPADSLGFTTVSVKPTPPPTPGTSTPFPTRMVSHNGEYTATNVTLQALIRAAYGVEDDQISGGPDWLNSEKFDLEAKMDESAIEQMNKLSPDQRHLEHTRMLQALLADHFKLALHRETKELTVYVMSIAKGGPKLQEAVLGNTYPNGFKGLDGLPAGAGKIFADDRNQKGEMVGQGLQMSSLTSYLSLRLRRKVLDKTGLTAKYDFTLQWAPADNQSVMFAAIQDQFGLALEPQTAPMEVLVIDHAEQPAAPQARTTGTNSSRAEAASAIPAAVEPNQSDNSIVDLLNVTQSRTKSRTQNAALVPPVFAAVSIKPASGNLIPGMWFTTDEFHATNVTLQMLIKAAFRVEDNQISGAPNWLNSEKFDIKAKMDKSVVDAMRPLSEDQRFLQQRRILQELLANRFRLTLHRETKESPEYDLVIAQDGPKLQEAKPGDTYPNGIKDMNGNGRGGVLKFAGGQLTGQGVSVALQVRELSRQLRATVLDKTGLKGNYDFTLRWTPDEHQPPMLEGTSGSSLFAGLQKQLGLRLVSANGPVDLLIIDHAEQPSEN